MFIEGVAVRRGVRVRLTEREVDKLLLSVAAMVARDRKARGLKLNYPEADAIIGRAGRFARRETSTSAASFVGSSIAT